MKLAAFILPAHDQMLAALDGWLVKAEADPRGDQLLAARLAEDMLPLSTQIRYLCNMPGEVQARTSGLEFTSSEDDDTTLAQVRKNIASARAQIATWQERKWIDDDAMIDMVLPNGMAFDLSAENYVRDWALPQYYFHLTTAYAIMRKEGLNLGKADFVPHMFKYMRADNG